MIGEPQLLVLIVLAQRLLEHLYALFNTRRLLKRGAREAGRAFFPVVAVTGLAWLSAIFLLVPQDTEIVWPLLALFIAIQFLRYWVIALLGRYWTLRIILPGRPRPVTRGPFQILAHPYTTLVMLETFLLPLVVGAWALSVVMTMVMGAVLYYRIALTDETLGRRRPA